MKELLKRYSIFVVLLAGFFAMMPMGSSAEEPSSPSGKLRFQTERIGKDGKSESREDKMTELEKSFPDLFKEETRAVVEEKQKVLNQETDDLKQMLFLTEIEKDVTMKETMKTLFASDYTVPNASVANYDLNENDNGIMGSTLFSSLIGMVVLLCGGIFAVMRKMVE